MKYKKSLRVAIGIIFMTSYVQTFCSDRMPIVNCSRDEKYDLVYAQVHGHIEAEVSEHDQDEFARMKGKQLPPESHPTTYKYDSSNWPSFAGPYFALCKIIDDAKDFGTLTTMVLERYRQQNVVFAELIYSPDLATTSCAVVLDWRDMLLQAQKAMTAMEEKTEGAMRVSGVVTFLRGDKTQGLKALEYVQYLIDHKNDLPNIRGVHLSGDEKTYPDVEQFADAYKLARENGLKCSVHAGETGDPENMWSALKLLKPDRIGHGIAAARDPKLMRELKDKSIPLEICVTSNFCMSNVSTFASHPLPLLLKEGVICLFGNTDDGRLFNTNVRKEAETLMDVFGFTKKDIIQNTKRIINHGFLPEEQKTALITRFFEKE